MPMSLLASRADVRSRAARGGRGGDEGVTLIEMLVALTVFALMGSGIAGMMITAVKTSRDADVRAAGAQIVARELDVARGAGLGLIAQGRVTSSSVVNDRTYVVTRDATYVRRGSTGSPCDSAGNQGSSYLRITATATWTPGNGGAPVAVTGNTVLSPRPGDVDPNSGNVAIRLLDGTGSPVAGIVVNGSIGTTRGTVALTQTTTAEGCAYFAYVPPSTYTFWLPDATLVGPDGQAPADQTSAVAASQTVTLQFVAGVAGTLRASTALSASFPVPGTVPVVLYNTAFSGATQTKVFAGTTFPRDAARLFPSPSGYVPWIGDCADADPGADLRPPAVTTTAGSTTNVTISTARIEVSLQVDGADASGPWTLTATHAPDAKCPTGRSYTFAASGEAVRIGMPYGEWTYTATQGAATAPPVTVSTTPESPFPVDVQLDAP